MGTLTCYLSETTLCHDKNSFYYFICNIWKSNLRHILINCSSLYSNGFATTLYYFPMDDQLSWFQYRLSKVSCCHLWTRKISFESIGVGIIDVQFCMKNSMVQCSDESRVSALKADCVKTEQAFDLGIQPVMPVSPSVLPHLHISADPGREVVVQMVGLLLPIKDA